MARVEQSQLVRNLSQWIRNVNDQTEPVVLTRYGKPTAVLMGLEQYRVLRTGKPPARTTTVDELLHKVAEQG